MFANGTVAEGWVRAWKSFPEFDAEGSFRLWTFRIAKNVLLESFRKLQRAAPPAQGVGPSTRAFQLQNHPDSATNISRRVARDEGVTKVLDWVRALGEEEQQLFLHCGLEGLSYAEAGERMALQRDTVAKRWQILRERLVQFGVPRGLSLVD
jgi:RNA polymerase sigma factor (sigma-70 family)